MRTAAAAAAAFSLLYEVQHPRVSRDGEEANWRILSVCLAGLYWGYQVRAARSLREVFSGHALKGDIEDTEGLYDCLIGTSERGVPLEEVASTLQYGSYR